MKKRKIDPKEAVEFITLIAKGLSKAHSHNIIHRDIKPANIIITDEGQIKVIDFGLAKLKGGLDLTKTGSSMGTLRYMSPEQIQGEKVDQSTDIWALGVTMYEMLTGEL